MKYISLCLIIFFVLAPAAASSRSQLLIDGVIGDFARQSRSYEINKTVYNFPKIIIIEDNNGKSKSYSDFQAGTAIKVYGTLFTDDGTKKQSKTTPIPIKIHGRNGFWIFEKIVLQKTLPKEGQSSPRMKRERLPKIYKQDGVWKN